jgi:hypothetical protein
MCAGEIGAVADCQNSRVRCSQCFIDDNAVVGFETGFGGQSVVGLHADADEDEIRRI